MQWRFAGLWRNSDFLKLWIGESISLFGTQITTLALPLVAVLMLKASPTQMGLLNAAAFVPFLLFSLPVGVFIDRKRRRPVLILSNLGRAVLLALVPLLAFWGMLHIEYLIVIAFLVGLFTVFFHLAYQSYLPSLVTRDQLVEGNSKLTASQSIAEIGGPGLAGLLIEFLSAPFAILLDAFTYAVSALTLGLIRRPEPAPSPPTTKINLVHEVSEGLRVVFGNQYLRAIAGEAASYNVFWNVIEAVYILYAVQRLGLRPGVIGLVFTLGSTGAFLGALMANKLASRFGVGPTLLGAMALACLVPLLIPLASGQTIGAVALLTTAAFLGGIGVAISNIHAVSLRQAITPNRLLGRMTASYRFLIYGTIPLGALLGGFLGEKIGLRPTLLVGALGISVAWLWVLFSPVRTLRQIPASPEATSLQSPAERVGDAQASISP
jgi:MFS family permease